MELEKIKELVHLIENSSLAEFSLKEGDTKIRMSKVSKHAPMAVSVMPEVAAEAAEEEELFITSPIVGTFYSASAPEVPAFVSVGDVVKAGQTVCIIEAMKLMNEIEAEFKCEIESILVSNEQKVEYGQPLFKVKKI